MGIKKYNPTTNGREGMSTLTNDEITTNRPEKAVKSKALKQVDVIIKVRQAVQHIGGGAKRKYRVIDFKRNKFGITDKVATVEYDPNRNANNIALINYLDDGEKDILLHLKI